MINELYYTLLVIEHNFQIINTRFVSSVVYSPRMCCYLNQLIK